MKAEMAYGTLGVKQPKTLKWIALRPDYEYPPGQSIQLSVSYILYIVSKRDQPIMISI